MDEAIKALLEEYLKELREIVREIEEITEGGKQTSSVGRSEANSLITKQTLLEVIKHEGVVRQAYKDSKGIWTWGVGVTSRSGHNVERYIGNPQPMSRVIEIYRWLLETRYLPDVLEAFKGHDLNEHQLAAALSFHYNTGAIKRASWVKSYKAGKIPQAKRQFMNWKKPSEIIPRRRGERDLFFDGKWTNDGTVTEFTRITKSGSPVWSSAKKVNIDKELS